MPKTASKSIENGASASDASFIADYLPYLLAHASHLISGQFHDHLRARGISVSIWRLLATLSGGDGMTVGALARIGLYNQPTTTKIIDRLEESGLVERRQDEKDRRKALVFITSEGRSVVDDLLGAAKAHEARVTASYTPEEMATLKRVLRTLISRLEDDA
ncbi:MarR family winged helix-turn-helix transcriptional regulator [Roseibium sp.]|uniref:MarR family winged helix-turn-helix transcriptional regulator n=1 Tax=Roseibium sp. TaxID=1936156 RepID=UPI003A969DBF